MNHTAEVVVIGGGVAGALTAAMLGRAGISTIIVDVNETPPPDFRCEKIHNDQAVILQRTGLADGILAAATPIREMWVARRGHLLGKMRLPGKPYEYGIAYDELGNAARCLIPSGVQFIYAKATTIATTPDTQVVLLSNGDSITARLIVLATGLNNNLGNIKRTEISKFHSVTFGFDIDSKAGFKFPALTYHPERPGKLGYVTIFPIGTRMRVNLFVYHRPRDLWLRQAKETPVSAMFAAMPRLTQFFDGPVDVVSDVRTRPVNLYTAINHYDQHGLVLIGDAFGTSCPAAGTGLNKVFTDVERLCNHHVQEWLATPGMEARKIQAFYKDPVKVHNDEWSRHEAFYIRSLAVDTALPWRIRRLGWIGFNTAQRVKSWRIPSSPSRLARSLEV